MCLTELDGRADSVISLIRLLFEEQADLSLYCSCLISFVSQQSRLILSSAEMFLKPPGQQ